VWLKAATVPASLQPSSQTSAAASHWDAEELQQRQEELDKRAAELTRREQEMQRTMEFQGAALWLFSFVLGQFNGSCVVDTAKKYLCIIVCVGCDLCHFSLL